MSATEHASSDQRVEVVIRELERDLRRLRVARDSRREMVGEVRDDLRAAAADGQDPGVFVGDVRELARRVTVARGLTPRPREPWISPVVGLVGGAAALVLGHVLVEVLHPVLTRVVQLDGHYPLAGPVLVFGLLALAFLAGTVGALVPIWRDRTAGPESIRRGLLTIPLGTLLGVAMAFRYAESTDFSTAEAVVYGEIALVAMPALLGIGAARWWGLRAHRARTGRAGERAAVPEVGGAR